MDQIQYKIKKNTDKWLICAGLKVSALDLGLLAGFTKYRCILCEC